MAPLLVVEVEVHLLMNRTRSILFSSPWWFRDWLSIHRSLMETTTNRKAWT